MKKEEKLYECRYCYKKKMTNKGQVCEICHSVFGSFVIELNGEKKNEVSN